MYSNPFVHVLQATEYMHVNTCASRLGIIGEIDSLAYMHKPAQGYWGFRDTDIPTCTLMHKGIGAHQGTKTHAHTCPTCARGLGDIRVPRHTCIHVHMHMHKGIGDIREYRHICMHAHRTKDWVIPGNTDSYKHVHTHAERDWVHQVTQILTYMYICKHTYAKWHAQKDWITPGDIHVHTCTKDWGTPGDRHTDRHLLTHAHTNVFND